MNERPWVKPLENFIVDEDSFVLKQRRAQRNIRICDTKEANSKIYTPSEGVEELNRLASFNTNDLDIHGFLYDRCTLDLFRAFMPDSYFKSQSMKFTARIIYLLDWFVNSLKDDEMYKASYESLYLQQFRLISQYNDHDDFDRRYAESKEFCILTPVEHMAMIREDIENAKSFKNGTKEYNPDDLTKFVVSYVYSVLEKDYNTNEKINEGTIPNWIMNFTPHKAISMGKTVLDWDEVDDESIFDNDATLLRAFRMIAQFATYPDIDDSSISSLFKEECIKIAAIAILSYVHALMSYGIAIYNTFLAEKLKVLWFYPDCIVDYIYSIYQHVRIDEAMIRYSAEINTVAIALSQCNMSDLFKKLCFPTPVNPTIPYNVPFSVSVSAAPSYQPLPEVIHSLAPVTNPSSLPPYLNMRVNQLETTVASLAAENDKLKDRLDKLEASYTSKDQLSISESDKEESCVHNDYVAYLYNNVYPKIDPFKKGADMEYEKWKSGMSGPVLNYFRHSMYNTSIESDDGTVIKHKCNLCGKHFVIDRRLITFSK